VEWDPPVVRKLNKLKKKELNDKGNLFRQFIATKFKPEELGLYIYDREKMLFSAIDFCSGEEENKLVFLNEVNKQKLIITKTKELLIEEINNPVCFKKVISC
jgi:hypothetical protein